MKDGDILLFLVCIFGLVSVLILLLCKFLKTKEKRKFRDSERKPSSNGGTELTEVVSKSPSELSATAPLEDQTGDKKRKAKKPLKGEDFYAGKTELPHSHQHHSDEEEDEDEKDGLEKFLFGKDDDEPSAGFF